jgi:metal-responsive CopG/Arc/MetJ family transcriptional regulator
MQLTYLIEISILYIMRAISLKIPEQVLRATSRCSEAMGLSRAEYIRRAIEEMNRRSEARLRAQRLAEASRRVREESLVVNAEFEEIEHDPGT